MEQRKWLTKAIRFRPPFNLESQSSIERNRLLILFVHVDHRRAQVDNRVPGKLPAQTRPTPRWVDKQRLHLCAGDADESHQPSLPVAHTPDVVECEQPGKHQRFEELDI